MDNSIIGDFRLYRGRFGNERKEKQKVIV